MIFELFQNYEINFLLYIQHHIRNKFLSFFMLFFTILTEYGGIFVLISLILFFIKKTKKLGIFCCSSIAIHVILTSILKYLIPRARPFVINSFIHVIGPTSSKFTSFPSGHATIAFTFAFTIFLATKKKIYYIPTFVIASLCAISRIYNCNHFPSDVLAGIVLGLLYSYLSKYIQKYVLFILKKENIFKK